VAAVTPRLSLGLALLGLLGGACQQTLVLDDSSPDSGRPSGTGGSGGKGVGTADASSDGRCVGGQSLPLQFAADAPQLLVVLDRSSAMSASFGTNDQLHAALSAIQAEVSRYSGGHNGRASIQFTFIDFPDTATDCNAANGCCSSDSTDSYADFQDASTCNGGGPMSCLQSMDRPTAVALGKAYAYFAGGGSQHSNDRYVMLVTDDDPQGPCPANDTACSDAIAAVGDLTDIGVTTEVVAIGAGAPCLSELATAQSGVFPQPYYVAAAPTDLPNMIDDVAQTVADGGCHLTLTQPPAGQITVVFNGVIQPQDSGTTGNGWNYGGNNDTRVFLHGSLCQNFLQGNPNSAFGLQIYAGCAPEQLQNP
jgi:hypothetical protein